MKNQQIVLAKRPRGGCVTADNFRYVQTPNAALKTGQVLVRVIYTSIDPAIRLWISEHPPWVMPIQVGEVITAVGLGIVEASEDSDIPVGCLVQGFLGWQQYSVCSGDVLTILPEVPGLPLTAHLSLLGVIGLTAYVGLIDLGEPKAGETIVVSGAAGAVGSLVGQIGKIVGCRVIGIAGGPQKCDYLRRQLGFDAAIDYKNSDVTAQLDDFTAASGIDIYFDNVGGDVSDAVIARLNDCGRVLFCGEISMGYSDERPYRKISSLDTIIKALKFFGVRVDLYQDRAEAAFDWLVEHALKGEIKYRSHVIDGLQNAPDALEMVFRGKNKGKMIVRVSPEP